MKHGYGEFRTIDIHFDGLQERQRAFELLETAGIPVPEKLKRESAYRPFPESTHLMHVQLKEQDIYYCPPPFICAAIVSDGCRIYTVAEFERIVESGFRIIPRFPIFHVPHDGWRFPEEMMASVCVPKEVFMDYHERMRDKDICKMLPRPFCSQFMCQRFEVSRLLCDVERFIGPNEIMERYGMGFCYEKAFDGTVIKRVTEEGKTAARKYYDEHHARINRICRMKKKILFFDMHSYSDEIIPPHARKPGMRTPDLCIGTDARFTPPRLKEIVSCRFQEIGFHTAENNPYSGFYIPEAAMDSQSGCDLIGIMLEFNRRAYCDSTGHSSPEQIALIQSAVKQIMADCVAL